MKYVYVALFEPAEEGGFNVSVPDIPGCFTCGDTMAESISMVEDALSMMLVRYEDDGDVIPPARAIKDLDGKGGILSYVLADTVEWRRKFNNRAVKKTLSIPSWLNAKAEKAGVNFSQVLKDALQTMLCISEEV